MLNKFETFMTQELQFPTLNGDGILSTQDVCTGN